MYNRKSGEYIKKLAKDLMPIIKKTKEENDKYFWKLILNEELEKTWATR